MKTIKHFAAITGLAVLTLLGSGSVWAQWHWIDAQGSKVFSDRPPGPEIPEKNILKRPFQSTLSNASTKAAGGAASTPLTSSTTPKPPGSTASAAKSDKGSVDQERMTAQKAQNCAAAQRQMAGLKAGGRIARFNEKGEREFLDDAARATEIRQTQKTLDSECK